MIYVTSVTITPSHISLHRNEGQVVRATVLPCNATCQDLCWCSDNERVVTVNETTGFLYAHEAGTATVYATAKDGSGKQGSVSVTVVPDTVYVNRIELNRTALTLKTGDQFELLECVFPEEATDPSVTWCSSNENVATVVGGVVTAMSAGFACICCAANDDSGVECWCSVTVTGFVPVSSIEVTPSSVTVTKTKTEQLSALVRPDTATCRQYEWSSSNEAVAVVNPTSGLVLAKEVGTAWVYATAKDGSGVRGSCHVTVTPPIPVTSIEVFPEEKTMYIGEQASLDVMVLPRNAENKTVTWTSSNDRAIHMGYISGDPMNANDWRDCKKVWYLLKDNDEYNIRMSTLNILSCIDEFCYSHDYYTYTDDQCKQVFTRYNANINTINDYGNECFEYYLIFKRYC